jgi:hypothetical protein
VLAAQLLATYLIHCPAHYLVGVALGIRFRSIAVGRTTLARVLPHSLAAIARAVPVLTLRVDRSSLARASKLSAAAMYAAGVVASCAVAILIAAFVTISGSALLVGSAWAVAIGYLIFDLVFSPRTGDILRARSARGSLPATPKALESDE